MTSTMSPQEATQKVAAGLAKFIKSYDREVEAIAAPRARKSSLDRSSGAGDSSHVRESTGTDESITT